MNTTKKHNPGDTICTCRVGEDRYEIKTAERLICGTLSEDCHFYSKETCPSFTRICLEHNIYFIKIQPKEHP